jgi:hypothetical protein
MAKKKTPVIPFQPTLQGIRVAQQPKGSDIAEAFDGVNKIASSLDSRIAALEAGKPATAGSTTVVEAAPSAPPSAPPSQPDTGSFASITSGVNTKADMTVGDGASLEAGGTGVINATEINGIPIQGTPAGGDVPIYNASSEVAVWAPMVLGSGTFEINDGTFLDPSGSIEFFVNDGTF